MAANNGAADSTGKKYYYTVSYGMLCANAKDVPDGYEVLALADIKSRRTKNENVDLRNKYYDTESGKKYPLRIFYTDINGVVESVEKDKYDKGTTLKVTLHDQDGDESIIQTDFYGKISADFLNRLLSVNKENQLNFRPYSIPSSFELNGETKNFYQAGVSIKDNGVKTERFFKGLDSGLPKTEQVQDNQGNDVTSRVKQVNFLWEKVSAKFAVSNSPATTQTQGTVTEQKPTVEEHAPDDLPF